MKLNKKEKVEKEEEKIKPSLFITVIGDINIGDIIITALYNKIEKCINFLRTTEAQIYDWENLDYKAAKIYKQNLPTAILEDNLFHLDVELVMYIANKNGVGETHVFDKNRLPSSYLLITIINNFMEDELTNINNEKFE